jgi:hypothetical protein
MKTAALLKSVTELDNEIVLEVIEGTEGSRLLAVNVREKIIKRLKDLAKNDSSRNMSVEETAFAKTDVEARGDPSIDHLQKGLVALFRLFHEIDTNGNGQLSGEEFSEFLKAVGIDFSRKKWHQIFRNIDLTHDDKVSFKEFFLFIFRLENVPDDAELERLQDLAKLVELKKQDFERNYVPSEPGYVVS